jgi:PERQ amino acid-rich with GYF domain-containing protein
MARHVVDDTANTLMALPLESDTIADAVYSMSDTINGKHFADEFIRRKKLADKGVVQPAGASSSSLDAKKAGSSSGGWSEVAKKGGNRDSSSAAGSTDGLPGFKVVPSRKKGKK